MHIIVLYSLPTARMRQSRFLDTETDTQDSALEVAEALRQKRASVQLVGLSPDGIDQVKKLKAELVFNLIEWTGLDQDLGVRAVKFLESTGICFTGATSQNYLLTTDKILFKTAMDKFRLPTALWQGFVTGRESVRSDFRYPLLIKLSREHCSIGLGKDSLVQNKGELIRVVRDRIEKFGQPVIAEEFLAGREFQVTIYEHNSNPVVLPPAEIFYQARDAAFLTYEARWDELHPDYSQSYICLAKLPSGLNKQLTKISLMTYRTFKFQDYARLDIRCDSLGQPRVMEANANPGLSDSDEYGMTISYKAVGMTFADFIWEIVESCRRRFKLAKKI